MLLRRSKSAHLARPTLDSERGSGVSGSCLFDDASFVDSDCGALFKSVILCEISKQVDFDDEFEVGLVQEVRVQSIRAP